MRVNYFIKKHGNELERGNIWTCGRQKNLLEHLSALQTVNIKNASFYFGIFPTIICHSAVTSKFFQPSSGLMTHVVHIETHGIESP